MGGKRPDCANISPGLPKPWRRLYAEVPEVNCKGLCQAQCSAPPAQPAELVAIGRVDARERVARPRHECPHLSTAGRCEVYAVRPLTCRLFGATFDPRLVCPHGCRAAHPLTREASARLVQRAYDLSPGIRCLDPVLDAAFRMAKE